MTIETIAQTQTIADANSGWSLPLAFTQFNASLGSLQDVQISIMADSNGSAQIENLGSTAADALISLTGTINVSEADGTQLASAAAQASSTVGLGAYDGVPDFAGTSGTIVTGITNTVISTSVFAPGAAGLAPFVGTGTIDLTVTGSPSFSLGDYGNLLGMINAQAGATVTVLYDYTPPGTAMATSSTAADAPATGGSGTADVANSSTIAGGGSVPVADSIANDQTTATQTLVVADATTSWNTAVDAAQFNPAMGTLVAVDVTLIGDINGTLAIENLGSNAVSVNTINFADVSMMLPGSLAAMEVSPLISNTASLAAFDGTNDYAGTSGSTARGLTNIGTVTSQYDSASNDLSSFVGTGMVSLGLNAFSPSTTSGASDVEMQQATQAGAEVLVNYVYVPSSGTTGDVVSPSIGGTVADQQTGDQATITPFHEVTITDPNANQTETVTVTQSDPANGTLSNLDGGTYNATLGVYTVSGSAAGVSAALDGLVFTPTAGQVAQGQTVTTGFTVTDSDNAGGTAGDSTTSVVATAGPDSFTVLDTTNGQATTRAGDAYSGPVAGLQYQCIDISADSLNITALVPNSFLRSGSGMDGLNVSGVNGNNILDGGTGSNFLTGGTGEDTFYLDDRNPAMPVFSTIANFHSGDNVTVWGINPTDFSMLVLDHQGAAGYTGVDLIFTNPNQPPVSFVLAGYTGADLTDGRLSMSYGTTPDLPGLPGSQYMTLHAN